MSSECNNSDVAFDLCGTKGKAGETLALPLHQSMVILN